MNDPLRVRRVQRVSDLNRQVQQFVCLQRLSGDEALDSLALQILNHDEGLALVFSDVINRADIRVIEGGSCLRFTLEPFQGLSILGEFLREELQGDGALELGVRGLVHHAHAPAAELLQDAIVADSRATHEEATSYELHLRPR